MRGVGWLGCAVLTMSAGLVAQNAPGASGPGAAEYVPTMTFDVASVRESKPDVNRGVLVRGNFEGDSSLFRAENFDFGNLLAVAYGVPWYQMKGLPDWPFPTVFNVEAKADSEADSKLAALTPEQRGAERRHMMQVLLADRFQLKAHWETQEGDVLNLVVSKGGPKLKGSGDEPPSAEDRKFWGERPVPAIYQRGDSRVAFDFVAHGCSMAELAGELEFQFGMPVEDKTGLAGKYSFDLKYHGARLRDRKFEDPDPVPPLDQALQDELGLKVEPGKGPVKVLVVDHVEKPSEN